jgi:hypothetical protein
VLTVQEVKDAAGQARVMISREGCFLLNPSVKLRCCVEDYSPYVKKGEIIHADMVDVKGVYPGCVHLYEKGCWWKALCFELVKE